jgi:hypothetical protein
MIRGVAFKFENTVFAFKRIHFFLQFFFTAICVLGNSYVKKKPKRNQPPTEFTIERGPLIECAGRALQNVGSEHG